LPDHRLGQLASGEHLEGVDVGLIRQTA
jgi:hypothetical protein